MELRSGVYSFAALAGVAFLLCSPVAGQGGLQLFHKMQTALGGAEQIASVLDFEQSVCADTWDNEGKPHGTVYKRVRWIRPNYLRIDQLGPDDTYVLYFDGNSGWEILPDKTVADLAGGELRFARDYLTGLNVNFWLADRDPNNVITSTAPNVITIATKDDPSHATDIALDPVTSLPVKQTSLLHADPDHPVPSEQRFKEWEFIGRVQFPQRITNFHSGKRLAEITVQRTRLNCGIKPSDVAIKPANLMPVMSR